MMAAATSKYTPTMPCASRISGGKRPRRERREQAERIGHEHAEADQRVHVGRAIDDAAPAAPVVVRTRPQHHRRRQQQLRIAQRGADARRQVQVQQMRQHRDRDHRYAASAAANQNLRRTVRSSESSSSRRGDERLERHAADRAGARARSAGSADAWGRCRSSPRRGRRALSASWLAAERPGNVPGRP